jgi:hypothetical protein
MPTDDELKEFSRKAYSRKDEQGNTVVGINAKSPQLTISRLRRCQNCLHFDIDDKARAVFKDCLSKDRRILAAKGCSERGIQTHIGKLHRGIGDRLGAVGVCTIRDKRTDDGARGDFTAFHYQCDQWSGRIIVTPQEAAMDPSDMEVYSNLRKVDE